MDSKTALERILHHHSSHDVSSGGSAPFLNIYVGDDKIIQLNNGLINPLFGEESGEWESVQELLDSKQRLTKEENLGWWLPNAGDWESGFALDTIEDLLRVLGHGLQDISHIEELDCPDGGVPNWRDLGAERHLPPGDAYDFGNIGQEPMTDGSAQHKSIQLHQETWKKLGENPDNPQDLPVIKYQFTMGGTDYTYVYYASTHLLRSVPEGRKQEFEDIFQDVAEISEEPYYELEGWEVYLELLTLDAQQQIGITHRLITEGYDMDWNNIEVTDIRGEVDHPRDWSPSQ